MRRISSLVAVMALAAAPVAAQDAALEVGLRVASITSDPAEIVIEAGAPASVSILALDANGQVVDATLRIRGRGVTYSNGTLTGAEGGEYQLIVSVVLPSSASQAPVSASIPVIVT